MTPASEGSRVTFLPRGQRLLRVSVCSLTLCSSSRNTESCPVTSPRVASRVPSFSGSSSWVKSSEALTGQHLPAWPPVPPPSPSQDGPSPTASAPHSAPEPCLLRRFGSFSRPQRPSVLVHSTTRGLGRPHRLTGAFSERLASSVCLAQAPHLPHGLSEPAPRASLTSPGPALGSEAGARSGLESPPLRPGHIGQHPRVSAFLSVKQGDTAPAGGQSAASAALLGLISQTEGHSRPVFSVRTRTKQDKRLKQSPRMEVPSVTSARRGAAGRGQRAPEQERRAGIPQPADHGRKRGASNSLPFSAGAAGGSK